MGLIMAALFTLSLVLIGIWMLSLRGSLERDRQAAAASIREEEQRQAQAARQARLHQSGVALHCLNCNHTFTGPLPDTGCPQCHLSALVVPEEEIDADRR